MKPRRRLHLDPPLLVYCLLALLLAVGGYHSQNNLLYVAFGVAVGALAVSAVVSARLLRAVEVRREPLPTFTVGATDRVHYLVRNRSRWLPVFGLSIEEAPVRGGRGSPAGRDVREALGLGPAHVVHVAPGATALADAAVTPARRGVATFERVRVSTRFPLGIVRRSAEWRLPATALVHPRTIAPPRSLMARAAARATMGGAPLATAGRGAEFHSLRPYRHGDSPRQIAWRATARTGELVVRENTATAPSRVVVGVSLRPAPERADGGAWDREAERALELAAGLLAEALNAGMDAGLSIPAAGLVRRTARTGETAGGAPRWLGRLLDDLAVLDTRAIAGVAHAGAGATVVVHTWPPDAWRAPTGAASLRVGDEGLDNALPRGAAA